MAAVLGVLLLVVALVLLSVALRGEPDARGVARSIALVQASSSAAERLVHEATPPFADRVLVPLRQRALTWGRRVSGKDSAERIRHRLDLAGNPPGWTVDRVLTLTVIGPVVGVSVAVLVCLLFSVSLTLAVVVVVGAAAIGFYAPGLYLYQKAYDRSEQMRRDLPDAIDLLTISVEAGLGFDAAVQQVAHNTHGPLAEELSRMLREMQLGRGRRQALHSLADRSNVAELRSFVGAMVQADSLGIPIAQVLRVQVQEIRVKRRQRAEARAQQVPVKITVPLIFCILPCVFVVVLGPAALNILDTF